VDDLDATYAELLVVGIDEDLARRAGELADQLGLRGYGAVHLASAVALGLATTLITWDAHLSAAAHQSGLAGAPPT
jgi:predicted nucleic acid-binding protein